MPTLSPEESRRDVIAAAAQMIAKVAKTFGISATCQGSSLRIAERQDGRAGGPSRALRICQS